MEIPVLLEPISTGFRASTQSPVPLSAEAGTETEAMAALSDALQQKLRNGAQLRTLRTLDLDRIEEITAQMRANPLHEEMEKAFEDYRKVANAVEDAD